MRSEERAGLPRVRVAVLGSSRVGKSALIVRYLTRRFIGEYHSNTDLLYRQTVPINGTPVELEVIDVSGSNPDNFPAEQVQWADACLLVYSVTDRESFEYAAELLTALRRTNTTTANTNANSNTNNGHMPLALIGNKTDLDHLRQVPTAEGQSVSAAAGASFSEASVADNTGELYRCMDRLLGECRAVAARSRKFSVSKMFGNFSFGSQAPTVMARSGSVVVCPRVPVARPPIAAAAP